MAKKRRQEADPIIEEEVVNSDDDDDEILDDGDDVMLGYGSTRATAMRPALAALEKAAVVVRGNHA